MFEPVVIKLPLADLTSLLKVAAPASAPEIVKKVVSEEPSVPLKIILLSLMIKDVFLKKKLRKW